MEGLAFPFWSVHQVAYMMLDMLQLRVAEHHRKDMKTAALLVKGVR